MEFLTDKEVALRYNVTRPTVWRWLRFGRIPTPLKLSPRCTRWNEETLRRWEQGKEEEATNVES